MSEPVAQVWTCEDGRVHLEIDFGEFIVEQAHTFDTEEDGQAAVDFAMEVLGNFTKFSVLSMGDPPSDRVN